MAVNVGDLLGCGARRGIVLLIARSIDELEAIGLGPVQWDEWPEVGPVLVATDDGEIVIWAGSVDSFVLLQSVDQTHQEP